jgi:hypothetical protein
MDIPKPTLRKAVAQPCYLYCFLGTVDRDWGRNEWMFVKVGVAYNVHRRLRAYQTHCPIPFSTGFRVLLPSVARARQLETTLLRDEELSGYRSQGEWFVILAGPDQHVLFIKDLLAAFYIERYRDKNIWSARLEWLISPDDSRLTEIPGANETHFCEAENGTGLDDREYDWERELELRVRAEAQAEALGRLIYPELDYDAPSRSMPPGADSFDT